MCVDVRGCAWMCVGSRLRAKPRRSWPVLSVSRLSPNAALCVYLANIFHKTRRSTSEIQNRDAECQRFLRRLYIHAQMCRITGGMAEQTHEQLLEQVALQVTELEQLDLLIREVHGLLSAAVPSGAEAPIRDVLVKLEACIPGDEHGGAAQTADGLQAYLHVLEKAKWDIVQNTRAAKEELGVLERRTVELRSDAGRLEAILQGLRADSDVKRTELAGLATRIAQETAAVNAMQQAVSKYRAETSKIDQETAAKVRAGTETLNRCTAECAEMVAKQKRAEGKIASAEKMAVLCKFWHLMKRQHRMAVRAVVHMWQLRWRAWRRWERVVVEHVRLARRCAIRAAYRQHQLRWRARRRWELLGNAYWRCAINAAYTRYESRWKTKRTWERVVVAHWRRAGRTRRHVCHARVAAMLGIVALWGGLARHATAVARQARRAQLRREQEGVYRCARAWRRVATRTWQKYLRAKTLQLRQATARQHDRLAELALLGEEKARRLPCLPAVAPRVRRDPIRNTFCARLPMLSVRRRASLVRRTRDADANVTLVSRRHTRDADASPMHPRASSVSGRRTRDANVDASPLRPRASSLPMSISRIRDADASPLHPRVLSVLVCHSNASTQTSPCPKVTPTFDVPARRAILSLKHHTLETPRADSACRGLCVELVRTEASAEAVHSTLNLACAILRDSLERAQACVVEAPPG